VVAGPKAVGKSHLIERLVEDDLLRERIGIPAGALVCGARTWLRGRPTVGTIDHLVLHYDILRPFDSGETDYHRDPATSALRCADQITFLTLRTSRARLCSQFDRRLGAHKPRVTLERRRRLRELYNHEEFLTEWYDRWLAFVGRWGAVTIGSYLVDPHDPFTLTSVDREYQPSDSRRPLFRQATAGRGLLRGIRRRAQIAQP
jgi:hypothetical protein